jgi:hypothetical protein
MKKRLLWVVVVSPALYAAAQRSSSSAGANGQVGHHFASLMAGILLFLLTEPVILYGTFKTWFRDPNHPIPPSPERFFHAAVFSFFAMVFTGAILTFGFSNVDVGDSPLMSFYGFNNVCVVFDSPPSTYICPVYWFFVAYLIGRYAVEDTKRVMRLRSIGVRQKGLSYGVNVFLVVSVALFFVTLSISPTVDVIGHTAPFMFLIVTMPSVFLMHHLQTEQRSGLLTVGLSVYIAAACANLAFDIYAFSSGSHVPPAIAQSTDILWVLCTVSAPFVIPAPAINEKYAATGI